MQASVKIMNIDVDMLSNDVFIEKTNEYLTEEKLHIILFASTELLSHAVADEECKKLIDMAECFLPGEKALLSAHHADMLEAGGMVVSWKSLGLALKNLKKEDRSIYIVSKSAQDADMLKSYCSRTQPELRIVGTFTYTTDIDGGTVVNEINSHIPDILLVDLETGMQEKWILKHASLLNTKLCIAIGGIAELIIAREKNIPKWIQKLHLDSIYHKLVREQSVKKDVRARIFRKKVVQYNNQIEDQKQEKDDNT